MSVSFYQGDHAARARGDFSFDFRYFRATIFGVPSIV